MSDVLELEVQAALDAVDRMSAAYLEMGRLQRVGEIQQMMYTDIVEFANLRMETVQSVTALIRARKVADALGLSRALLENALLLQLLCRGNRHFTIESDEKRTPAEWKAALKTAQETLAEHHANGEHLDCLSVEKYPRPGRPRLMWLYEGLHAENEPDFTYPIHNFHFKDFKPAAMRLDDADYFDDLPAYYRGRFPRKRDHKRREEATFRYRHYLSYDALLACLTINGLASKADILRIEAHYTYLGQFLHPTSGAARDLHDQSNYYMGGFSIGLKQNYSPTAPLLAALYAVWLTRMLLEEIADLFDGAPARFIGDPGTAEVRPLLEQVARRFKYFWFISNEAPSFDKFNHAVTHATDEDRAAVGGYAGIPSEQIKFDPHIHEHLQRVLQSASNIRVGRYRAPLDR